MTSTPCAQYEFRITAKDDWNTHKDEIISCLKGYAKHWVFQLETGDTGYVHFQGNMSLIKKRRQQELVKVLTGTILGGAHLRPLSNNALKGELFYCIKEDTRTQGPWKDTDKIIFIPYQYEGLESKLLPFQQKIWDEADRREKRLVNLVIDPEGCNGKSTLASLMELHERGIDLPPTNEAKELIQSLADILIAKDCRDPKSIFIDIPRAMKQDKLFGLYTAIEQIKKGKVYDVRHSYKYWWFHSPQVWVFTNVIPDVTMLSADRWVFWGIKDKELVPYTFSQLELDS